MKFKLRHMEVFRAIMLTGSTSGAARMLFVSQPVVSRTLAHIESSLGLTLFDRKNGMLKATENARVIFREVDELYGAAGRIDSLVENLKERRKQRISFCSSPALGLRVVPRAMTRFLKQNPDVSFAYRTGLIKDMPAELLGKICDFALSIWPIDHPNLDCRPLFGGRICLVVPARHPLARRKAVELKDLRGMPLILYQQDMPMGAVIRERLRAAGIDQAPLVEINRSEQACALVNEGLGAALVNQYCINGDLWRGLAVKTLDLDIPAAVYLLTSTFEPLRPECQAFIQTLVENVESMEAAPLQATSPARRQSARR